MATWWGLHSLNAFKYNILISVWSDLRFSAVSGRHSRLRCKPDKRFKDLLFSKSLYIFDKFYYVFCSDICSLQVYKVYILIQYYCEIKTFEDI